MEEEPEASIVNEKRMIVDEEVESLDNGQEQQEQLQETELSTTPPPNQTPPKTNTTTTPPTLTKRPRLQFDKFEEYEEKEQELAQEATTKHRRLDYLLKKSEFYSHCLTSGETSAEDASKRKKKDTSDSVGSSRHRKTEKEEDEELLQNTAAQPLVTFLETPPYIKNGKMRDYQIRGLNWLISLYENGINGILADEMGLGKTLQTISVIGYLKHYKHIRGHSLVIVPKSTLRNWENEFEKWCPSMRIISLIGTADERRNIIHTKIIHLNQWDVLLTTYEMVNIETSCLRKITWNYLVIDEAHRIKNEKSLLSDNVRKMTSRHRLLLSGTPLQNNLHELWALLNFLLPDVFDSAENFDDWFNTESCLVDNSWVTRLHSVLRPFLLRRIKADVEKSLLPKVEIKVYVPLVQMQRLWYKNILLKDIDVLNNFSGKVEKVRLMNILMHLRKCCNHPYLFTGAEPGPPYTNDVHIVNNSGKLMVLDKLLPKLKSEGSRVLIFSQMTRMLDILEDYCFLRRFLYYRLDGQTAHEERQKMIDEYNSEGSQTFIFMLSTRAGGLGINLASADVVIIYDSDWNPQMDLQAMDRAHRIGQTKQVRVFRLITENTVDEKIIEKAAIKLKLDKLVIQQGRLTDSNSKLKNEDMLQWIRYGANLAFSDAGQEMISDETIESILTKSKSKAEEADSKIDKFGEESLRNFTLDTEQPSSLHIFEGEDYRDKSKKMMEWIEPPKRERKVTVYSDKMFCDTKEDKDFVPKNPKPPKHPNLPDFQFFPKRLHDLLQKEVYYYQQTIKYKIPREMWQDTNEAIKRQKIEQKKIDTAKQLTAAERAEKEILFEQGHVNWQRRDFSTFLKLLEKHGRDNLDLVAEEFPGKEADEVLHYARVFRKRFSELKNSEKIFLQITKGEEKRMRTRMVEKELKRRISFCRRPLLELNIPYKLHQVKMNNFTIENDRFLLITWNKIGFNHPEPWFEIRKEILNSPDFRFDWFFKSRNLEELQKRCKAVWSVMEKDIVTEEKTLSFQRKMSKLWANFTPNESYENDEEYSQGSTSSKRGRKSILSQQDNSLHSSRGSSRKGSTDEGGDGEEKDFDVECGVEEGEGAGSVAVVVEKKRRRGRGKGRKRSFY